MARNKFKNRIFRLNRRIRGLTDYRKRLEYLKSGKTRIVIRKFNNNLLVQFTDYKDIGDNVLTSARAYDLKKYGYDLGTGNIVSAYLTGYLAGRRYLNLNKGGDECIVDLGLQKVYKKGRVFAAVKGIIDSGVNVKVEWNEEDFVSNERLIGKHLNVKNVEKVIDKVKVEINKVKKQ